MVACAPVPNAWPGSITRSIGVSAGGSHGGRTVSAVARAPAAGGSCASAPPSRRRSPGGDVDVGTAGGGLEVWQRRQLARSPVDRVLDDLADRYRPPPHRSAPAPAARPGPARRGCGGRGRRAGSNRFGLAAEGALELAEHALVGAEVVLGQALGQLLQQLRCSRLRWRGMITLTTTRRSPWRRPRSAGMPSPRTVSDSCGWVPAGISSSVAPSTVGTSTVVPSAASGAAISTTVTRSSPRGRSGGPHARGSGRRGRRRARRARRRGRGP